MDDMATNSDVPTSPTDLPTELFQLITRSLNPEDLVRCRLVCKSWNDVLTNPELLRTALLWHHAQAREVRMIRANGESCAPIDTMDKEVRAHWVRLFDQVAARYRGLRSGRPWSTSKIQSFPATQTTMIQSHMFSRDEKENYDFYQSFESIWTYEDGLLIYLDKTSQRYVLLDIENNTKSAVPFENFQRTVMRIRLRYKVLIIESIDIVSQFFKIPGQIWYLVSAFDVEAINTELLQPPQWNVIQRNEWQHRYFGYHGPFQISMLSAHNARCYVAYTWQPCRNRNVRRVGAGEFAVWDFSLPSTIRRSVDVVGSMPYMEPGPQNIFSFQLDMESWFSQPLKQPGFRPLFRRLEIDESNTGMLYIIEDNSNVLTVNASDDIFTTPEQSQERIAGYPLTGGGPVWADSLDIQPGPRTTGFLLSHPPKQGNGPKRATGWRYPEPSKLGMQLIHDENTNTTFSVVRDFQAGVTNGGQGHAEDHVWISGEDWSGDKWSVRLQEEYETKLNQSLIHGDERWIVGQHRDEIYILRFDRDT